MGSLRISRSRTRASATTANARISQPRRSAATFTPLINLPPGSEPNPTQLDASYIPERMAARRPTTLVRAAFWPAGVAITIFAVHLPSFLHRLLDGDEAIYGSIAVLMNMGGGLYDSGGVDNKPPGVFWIYFLIFRLFGAYQMTAVHAVGFVAIAATCVLQFPIGCVL